jgi:predicted nucleic acid-binding Zn ribbon protein
MNDEEPVPLRDALDVVGKELGLGPVSAFDAVATLWQDIVGADGAPHSRVRSLRNGECTIEVDGPVWASRARYLTGELVRRASVLSGGRLVTAARVVVSGSRSAG